MNTNTWEFGMATVEAVNKRPGNIIDKTISNVKFNQQWKNKHLDDAYSIFIDTLVILALS